MKLSPQSIISSIKKVTVPLLLMPSDSPPPPQLLPSIPSLPSPVLLLLDITATFSINQPGSMRELVVKYKAEKVCHEEMVKMPLVDLKVLEVYTKSKEEHESHLKMNLELLKKEKCHVKPNKTKREGDCLYDATTGDSCEERHDSRYGQAWWFCLRMLEALGDVRTLIMEDAHATKYSVRPGTEIGEGKMIGLEMEQETTKVVVIKERLKEAKDHQES
uniref:Reverse transcriptase domain-containing protein n=1 Tax=Tanacetum cinerariifolium TaxID=118510 RepID=A0A6L2K6L2_TANCI|nr:hypothetical protein [Tanacetum cinerariifolium]